MQFWVCIYVMGEGAGILFLWRRITRPSEVSVLSWNMIFFLAEENLENFIANKEDPTFSREWNVQEIERVVTAESFCSCRDPIDMAFKVSWNSGHCPCRLAGCG